MSRDLISDQHSYLWLYFRASFENSRTFAFLHFPQINPVDVSNYFIKYLIDLYWAMGLCLVLLDEHNRRVGGGKKPISRSILIMLYNKKSHRDTWSHEVLWRVHTRHNSSQRSAKHIGNIWPSLEDIFVISPKPWTHAHKKNIGTK